jgi:hypothetical protein
LIQLKKIFENILSEEFRERVERIFIWIAIISFILHLSIILLVNLDIVHLNSQLIKSPISAIYTPFSFILVYEVFLLVFYLPRSISSYIAKQYEIITLIVIRRIFKDIGYMDLSPNWFKLNHDLQFTYDLVTALILFFIIQQFYQKLGKQAMKETTISLLDKARIDKFIKFKKTIATILIPTVVAMVFLNFINLSIGL